MPRARVACFINYKGGVGKSTTTYHVGCSLVQHHGLKTLLIDIDPQTNLTFLCAQIPEWRKKQAAHLTIAPMYQRFVDKKPLETKRFIWQAPISVGRRRINGLDLIPCDINLLGEDLGVGQLSGQFTSAQAMQASANAFIRDRSFLVQAIREVENDYDYVLIDCPPNLYLMTQNALIASQRYFVTAIPDYLSTIGLEILGAKVTEMGQRLLHAAKLAGQQTPLRIAEFGGVIFVKVRTGGTRITLTHQRIMREVADVLGEDAPFREYTTELIGYGEAAEASLPVWENPTQNSRAAAGKREYEMITEEFLERL